MIQRNPACLKYLFIRISSTTRRTMVNEIRSCSRRRFGAWVWYHRVGKTSCTYSPTMCFSRKMWLDEEAKSSMLGLVDSYLSPEGIEKTGKFQIKL